MVLKTLLMINMSRKSSNCRLCGKQCYGTICRSCFCKDKWRNNYRINHKKKIIGRCGLCNTLIYSTDTKCSGCGATII